MPKPIIIIIIIAIAAELGYFFFQSLYNPKIEAKDDISILFDLLKHDGGVKFSDIQAIDVQWNIKENQKTEKLTIKGRGFQAVGILPKNYRQIQIIFGRSGFGLDINNISVNKVMNYMGYAKNQNVCIVAKKQWVDDKGILLENGEMDVTIKCGQRQ